MTSTTSMDKATQPRPWRLVWVIGSGVVLSIAIVGLAVLALPYLTPGRVEGDGFLRQRGGDVITCASSQVWLFRLTEDEKAGLLSSTILLPDEIQRRFRDKDEPLATTVCGVDGRFIFDDVPHGTYGVVTTVEWLAGDRTQGGDVYGIVEVSPKDPIGRSYVIYSVE